MNPNDPMGGDDKKPGMAGTSSVVTASTPTVPVEPTGAMPPTVPDQTGEVAGGSTVVSGAVPSSTTPPATVGSESSVAVPAGTIGVSTGMGEEKKPEGTDNSGGTGTPPVTGV